MTAGMLRFSWHIVTVMLFGFAALLMTLSVATGVQPTTIVLRWVSAQWAVASLLAFWQIRRRPGSLLRLPVPLFFPVLAALCWAASL